jgi:hypothetical protein
MKASVSASFPEATGKREEREEKKLEAFMRFCALKETPGKPMFKIGVFML